MSYRDYSPNKGRGYGRDLPVPSKWTNTEAERVYRSLFEPRLIDMYLVEAYPRPECTAWPATPRGHEHTDDCTVCANLRSAYGDSPHVVPYVMWDEPGHHENAEQYIARHIANARQRLGGVPWHGATAT